jgi:hypothetical protein
LKFLLTILNLGAEQFLVKHVQAKLYERGVAMSEALSNELPQIVKVPLSLVQTGFGLRGVKLAVKQCAHLFSLYSPTHRATKGLLVLQPPKIVQDIRRNDPMFLRMAYSRVLWMVHMKIFTCGLFTKSLHSALWLWMLRFIVPAGIVKHIATILPSVCDCIM